MTKDGESNTQFTCNANPNLAPSWDKVTISYGDEDIATPLVSSSGNIAAEGSLYPLGYFNTGRNIS